MHAQMARRIRNHSIDRSNFDREFVAILGAHALAQLQARKLELNRDVIEDTYALIVCFSYYMKYNPSRCRLGQSCGAESLPQTTFVEYSRRGYRWTKCVCAIVSLDSMDDEVNLPHRTHPPVVDTCLASVPPHIDVPPHMHVPLPPVLVLVPRISSSS